MSESYFEQQAISEMKRSCCVDFARKAPNEWTMFAARYGGHCAGLGLLCIRNIECEAVLISLDFKTVLHSIF